MKNFLNSLKMLLVWDQTKNQYSHTKFWSNIGYGVMCYTFTYAIMYGTSVDVMIWAMFGVVVIGNRTILKLFTKDTPDDASK